jgi:hypothetical protein
MIEKMLEAAAQAPNHHKVQPWRFIVLTGAARERLGDIMAASLLERQPDATPEIVAVERAKPLRAPMIIVVGLTGITNLLVPRLNAPIIYLRLALLTLSSMYGLTGFVIGVLLFSIHILNLQSFGTPQVENLKSFRFQNIKDSVFRAPWWEMLTRPRALTSNRTRMKIKDGGSNDV